MQPRHEESQSNVHNPFETELLGEFETSLMQVDVGSWPQDRHCAVWLEREPRRSGDSTSIRAENRHWGLTGYVPREVTQWLAPLLDRRAVHIEAVLPAGKPTGQRARAVLTVFAGSEKTRWLSETTGASAADALHEMVRRNYLQCQRLTSPEAVRGIAEGLAQLVHAELRPETRLLIALLPALARECLAAKSIAILAAVRRHLSRVQLGAPRSAAGLTVFPLQCPTNNEPVYLLLADAIERNLAEVGEASEAGSVPQLRVLNRGDLPLLIPEGEILIGAKQNRVVNATVLVAAHSEFNLPVSCVEQGRWGYQTRQFQSAFWAPPRLRSKKLRSVQQRRTRDGRAESDQHGVWNDVAGYLHAAAVPSSTGSLADSFVAHDDRLRMLREQIALPDDAIGALVARETQVLGVDLFDVPPTFSRLWPRVADAYFLEALRIDRPAGDAERDLGERFLGRLVDSARFRTPSLGLGDEVEFSAPGVVGGGLLYDDRLCHLAAFTEAD